MSRTKESYQPLVDIIEKLMSEIEQCLKKLAAEESCEIEGMIFSLDHVPDPTELIDLAMKRAQSELDAITTRNQERHRELVDLLLKKSELQRIIDGKPLFSAGYLHKLNAADEMEKVEKRLTEIMEGAEETVSEGVSVED